jgi:EAL domain-containing protein (putative c-di-GMP-specific phosphodiesterase class I)
MLRDMARDEYQGFLLSRPIEAGAVDGLIARNSSAIA